MSRCTLGEQCLGEGQHIVGDWGDGSTQSVRRIPLVLTPQALLDDGAAGTVTAVALRWNSCSWGSSLCASGVKQWEALRKWA
jgi:hypothetical protein